jgi:hypothetical protein
LDVDDCNLVACHVGLDLVVFFHEHEEMVEMLYATVLNANVVDNEAKLDRMPFVLPKSRS